MDNNQSPTKTEDTTVNTGQSNTKKAFKNTFFQLLAELVTEIYGFILPGVMLRAFGSALTGLVSSINQLLKYLKKMEAGLSTASAVSLYAPLAKGDYDKASEVVSTSKAFYRRIGVYFSIGALILAFIYPFVVEIEVDDFAWYKVTTLVIILAANGAFTYFVSAAYQALLIADQKYYIVSVLAAVFGLITIPAMLLVILTDNILLVQLVSLIISVVHYATLAIYAKRIYRGKIKKVKTRDKSVMSMRWEVLINEVGILIENNAPFVIVTFMMGTASVAVYAIYNMVFQALQSIVRISRDALRPAFGQVWAKGEVERTKTAYDQYEWLIYTMTFVLYTTCAILILSFVKLYTASVTDVEYIIPLFAFSFCLSGAIRQIQVPASVMIGAAGKFREVRTVIIITSAICLGLGISLCYFFGLSGVMVAMVIATFVRTSYSTYLINKKVLGRKLSETIWRLIRLSLATAISFLPFILCIKINPASLYIWLVWAVCVFLWVLLVHGIFAIIFERDTAKQMIGRVFSVIGIKTKKS